MATRIVIEKQQGHLPSIEIHLNVLLTAKPGNTSVYRSPAVHKDDRQLQMSPVGHQLMERIEMIPGLGSLMYCSYSFQFNLALAFDHAGILLEVVDIIRQVLDDELEIHVQSNKQTPPAQIQMEEVGQKLRELTA